MQQTLSAVHNNKTVCQVLKPDHRIPDLIEDARTGLLEPPRSLPPKYFYDARGSVLFEQITVTPEYYPTRTEDNLLERHAVEIIQHARPHQILELGSGSSRKTRRLFDACAELDRPCNYAPMDVCEHALLQAADELGQDYDWLQVQPIVGDYHGGLAHLPAYAGRRLFVFLGSTIGNFENDAACHFMDEIAAVMQPGDSLLLGADRVKDPAVLEAAYNDAEGMTAAFNLNLLEVLNRKLDADFVRDQFQHKAIYDTDRQRIEMRLISTEDQTVHLMKLAAAIHLRAGEHILTEVSHKFTPERLQQLINGCGLEVQQHYQAGNQYFSLLLAEKQH